MIHIEQHRDRVPVSPLRWAALGIAVGIIVSIAATLLLAGRRLAAVQVSDDARPRATEATPYVFRSEAEQRRVDAEQRLERFGWVDRAHGIAHVPLDVAIDHYLEAPP